MHHHPDLPPGSYRELQILSVCVTTALTGVVSDQFRKVSVHRRGDGLLLRIVLADERADDLEEIADLPTEVEALWGGPLRVDMEVTVMQDPLPSAVPDETSITVFRRREW